MLDLLATREIVERQAMALIPVFAVDDDVRKWAAAAQHYSHGFDDPIEHLIDRAKRGAHSDELRERASTLAESLVKLKKIARYMSPILYFGSAAEPLLSRAAHVSLFRWGEPRVERYVQVSGGPLEPGDVRRFVVTGYGWRSVGETTSRFFEARELLTAEQLEERGNDAAPDENAASGIYRSEIVVDVGEDGEEDTFYAGNAVSLLSAHDDEEPCKIGIFEKKRERVQPRRRRSRLSRTNTAGSPPRDDRSEAE